jgi:hypothetical protein
VKGAAAAASRSSDLESECSMLAVITVEY